MVADLAMSIDKILAVADATKGDLFLLIFGLDLSIPFIVFTSNVLSRVMDKYPLNVYIGAGILGRVTGDMTTSASYIPQPLLK